MQNKLRIHTQGFGKIWKDILADLQVAQDSVISKTKGTLFIILLYSLYFEINMNQKYVYLRIIHSDCALIDS